MKEKSAKNRIIIVLLLFAIAGVISFILFLLFMNSDEQRIKRQLSLGEKYLDEMDYENAILAYNMAIAIDPNSAESYVGLAEAYAGIEDYDKSLDTIKAGMDVVGEKRELLEQRAKTIELYLAVGDACYQLKKYDEAIEIFNRIIAADPQTTDAYIGIANAYIEQGMYEEALEVVNKGIEANGKADSLVKLKERIEPLLSPEEPQEEDISEEEDEPEEENFTQEKKELYADFLRNTTSDPDFPTRFELIYVDEDDIPELAVASGEAHVDHIKLYRILGGEVVFLGEFGYFSNMEYIDHENLFHDSTVYFGDYMDGFYSIDGSECKCLAKLDYFETDGTGAVLDEYRYMIDDSDVSKQEYDDMMSKMSGNYIVCDYMETMDDITEENILENLFDSENQANDNGYEATDLSNRDTVKLIKASLIRSSPVNSDYSNVIYKGAADSTYTKIGEYKQWTKILFKEEDAYVETEFVTNSD